MAERVPMTRAGYESLKNELSRLKSEDRVENVKDIEEALAHGDISENAEFHAAKEQQSHIAGRIAATEDKLARAQIIDSPSGPVNKIQFGATVVLEDSETDEVVTYRIVGEDEADPKQGMISITAPVAQALMSKEVGDEATVKVPGGKREFAILEIRFD
jgi:transcription elongation factor GreA